MDVSVTVMVLEALANGVLCWMDLTVKSGTNTRRGSDPLSTPKRLAPGLSIATCARLPTTVVEFFSVAAMLTAGDVWLLAALVRLNAT